MGRASGGVQAGTVTGGNSFHAELATARVLKSRQVDQRSVHFVTFQGTLPHLGDTTVRFGYIYAIEHTDSGCRIIGEAGGGGDPPTRSRPWVNLAGGHANDHFWAGGEIERAGADIARVQLRFADGHVVEDDPSSDIALFIVNAPVQTPGNSPAARSAPARRSPNIRASPNLTSSHTLILCPIRPTRETATTSPDLELCWS